MYGEISFSLRKSSYTTRTSAVHYYIYINIIHISVLFQQERVPFPHNLHKGNISTHIFKFSVKPWWNDKSTAPQQRTKFAQTWVSLSSLIVIHYNTCTADRSTTTWQRHSRNKTLIQNENIGMGSTFRIIIIWNTSVHFWKCSKFALLCNSCLVIFENLTSIMFNVRKCTWTVNYCVLWLTIWKHLLAILTNWNKLDNTHRLSSASSQYMN